MQVKNTQTDESFEVESLNAPLLCGKIKELHKGKKVRISWAHVARYDPSDALGHIEVHQGGELLATYEVNH